MKHTVIKIRKTNAIKHETGHKNRQRNRVQMKNITLSIPGETNYYMQEAYKTLRTNILFCGSDIKTIGLTSCADNEGKSVITIGIAKSFAEQKGGIFFVWGHSYELDAEGLWERFEDFCRFMSGSSDVISVTNGEIFNIFGN